MFRTLTLFFALAALAACGSDIKKDLPPPCGNGFLDRNEACDPGIAAGEPGACPTECPATDACSVAVVIGNPQRCSAECVPQEPTCGESDGCCPSGCDSTSDADCSNTCGNGVIEGNETCDGDCPQTCDDRDTCTLDSFSGSADTCSLTCQYDPIAACQGGDGCCPVGCDAASDSDCSDSCGNGTTDPGELCDGNCPTDCDDGQACTSDRLVGSPSTCNAQCLNDPITTCVGGDGCCPAGCTFDNDSDCNCQPTTCADRGWSCGMLDDGCGTVRNCGTCSAQQSCSGGTCVDDTPDGGIGSSCTTDSQCDSGVCLDEATTGWPGGYCSEGCLIFQTGCETQNDGVCDGVRCVEGCNVNSDCRGGYECYAELGSTIKACYPVGQGNQAVGQSCTSTNDCSGGHQARCRSPQTHKNGYCSMLCDSTNPCPAGSHCADDVNGVGICLRTCTSNTGCRGSGTDGYMCYDLDDDGTKECFVAGTGNGPVGGPCDGPWECGGGAWGRCGTESGGFPDGYCSIACGTNRSTCPSGSHCATTVTTDFCAKNCTTDLDCRTGYTCQDDGTIDACWP